MGCKDVLDQAVEGSPVTRLQQYAQILNLSVCMLYSLDQGLCYEKGFIRYTRVYIRKWIKTGSF